ncbi:MAG: 30S ribosomal protein S10 [Alphaproteobacteria bacterium]|nr:MAG: 30S ribosomal protein S10 [Alphaproteobacteria bacterium]
MAKSAIKISLRAYDHKMLDHSIKEIVSTAKRAGGTIVGPISLPTRIRRYTVNRSPHIDKKSREQFEVRTHKRLLKIDATDMQVMDSLTKMQLPSGVNVKIALDKKGA